MCSFEERIPVDVIKCVVKAVRWIHSTLKLFEEIYSDED
jgi:hypothetical protein